MGCITDEDMIIGGLMIGLLGIARGDNERTGITERGGDPGGVTNGLRVNGDRGRAALTGLTGDTGDE